MTLSKSTGSARARVQIATVDTANRRVEGLMKDGSTAQIAVWDDAGNAFRWPQENEIWIIQQTTGIWRLVCRVQQGQVSTPVPTDDDPTPLPTITSPEPVPIESMAPGQMKLDGNVVIDDSGNTFVAVDLTGIEEGWTLSWNATLNRFVAAA